MGLGRILGLITTFCVRNLGLIITYVCFRYRFDFDVLCFFVNGF